MLKRGSYWAGDYDGCGKVVKDMLEPILGRFSINQGEVGKRKMGRNHTLGDFYNDTFAKRKARYDKICVW